MVVVVVRVGEDKLEIVPEVEQVEVNELTDNQLNYAVEKETKGKYSAHFYLYCLQKLRKKICFSILIYL